MLERISRLEAMSIDVKRLGSRRRISDRTLWIIVIGCFLVALAVFMYLGYSWRWTGFQGNKLFDWLEILVQASIPVAVAIGTFALNRNAQRRHYEAQKEQKIRDHEAQEEQKKREEAIETRREEEASLQAYFDRISRMLVEQELQRATLGDNLSTVARAHTLTVLERLEDGARKRSVLQFLYEAHLINKDDPVISLVEANLQGANLYGAYLEGAYLRGANLREAKLSLANLHGADLKEASLKEADLFGTSLHEADLCLADLQGATPQAANFQWANLRGAKLRGTYLYGAFLREVLGLTQEQSEQAIGDEGTTLPERITRPRSWSSHTDEPTEEE
jgi:uncharacterized protein YjbI with pentapeptide repeats